VGESLSLSLYFLMVGREGQCWIRPRRWNNKRVAVQPPNQNKRHTDLAGRVMHIKRKEQAWADPVGCESRADPVGPLSVIELISVEGSDCRAWLGRTC
jgi:hypothetical protein